MKLAYFSPLPPLKSGVADYSAELLLALRKFANIDVFVSGYKVSDSRIADAFNIFNIREFPQWKRLNKYDTNIYHIGNNHLYHEEIYNMALIEPGVIVLHDMSIHHMIAAMLYGRGKMQEYLAEVRYNHGAKGEAAVRDFLDHRGMPPWEQDGLSFHMTKRVIDSAEGVIVHSLYARQHVKSQRRDVPVEVVNLYSELIVDDEERERLEARRRLGIPSGVLMLASFGYIGPNRRIGEILKAVQTLQEPSEEIVFYMVGEINDPGYDIKGLIRALGIEEKVVITGYVGLDHYLDLMKAADICFNLRYPYYGETSGNLHRMLGMGKVVFISNVGAFREYPDNCVIKVSVGNESQTLTKEVRRLVENPALRRGISENALMYAKRCCTLEGSARRYASFIGQIERGLGDIEKSVESVAGRLLDQGVEPDDGARIRAGALKILQGAQ